MIDRTKLNEIAKLKGLSLGNAEKDYLLELVLLIIAQNTKNELVFKGGTALYKFYNLDRFSEDLDFSSVTKIKIKNLMKKVVKDLSNFNIEAEIKSYKQSYDTILIKIRAKGPLFSGIPMSFSSIQIDINLKSEVIKEIKNVKLISIYPDIPTFSVVIMDEKEIFAEKLRAILTRNKARDVYDLWFLLKKGVYSSRELVNHKLSYYNKTFHMELLKEKLDEKTKLWDIELKPLLKEVPESKKVKKYIMNFAKKFLTLK